MRACTSLLARRLVAGGAGPRMPSGARALLPAARTFSTTAPIPNDEHSRPMIHIEMGASPPDSMPDPFALMADHLKPLDGSLRELVGSDHPVLTRVAQHFFELAGKRFRPTIVLLASSAAAGGAAPSAEQTRLAEITEMIHAASLLHDDVIDLADTRRGTRAAHRIYGNKVAVLAGDFLLARASVLLSRLGDIKVVELLATVIEEMVQGELMQVKALPHEHLEFDHYLSKTYRKTAALMSLSCQASAKLAGQPEAIESAMQAYGRHLGIAYQLVDDMLDFVGTADALGKPALSDMEQGLATAPTLFAAEEFPEINEIVQRRFGEEGDVATVSELVHRSDGLARTRTLATSHARSAADALGVLPPSASRDALLRLCFDVLNRQA
jgi:all-trans-nonaprenyl-diphosphate synthase